MLKRKEGESYAQHRARTLGVVGLGARLAMLAGALLMLAIMGIAAAPQIPDADPCAEVHDLMARAVYQDKQGVTP